MDAETLPVGKGHRQADGVFSRENRSDAGDVGQPVDAGPHQFDLGGDVLVGLVEFRLEFQVRVVGGNLEYLARRERKGHVVFVAGIDRGEHLVSVLSVGFPELRPLLPVDRIIEITVADGDEGQHADGEHLASVRREQPLRRPVPVLDGPVIVPVFTVALAGDERLLSVLAVGDGDGFVLDEVDAVARHR